MLTYNGGCLCGNIRYMYSAEPTMKVSISFYFILWTIRTIKVANLGLL